MNVCGKTNRVKVAEKWGLLDGRIGFAVDVVPHNEGTLASRAAGGPKVVHLPQQAVGLVDLVSKECGLEWGELPSTESGPNGECRGRGVVPARLLASRNKPALVAEVTHAVAHSLDRRVRSIAVYTFWNPNVPAPLVHRRQ